MATTVNATIPTLCIGCEKTMDIKVKTPIGYVCVACYGQRVMR